MDCVLGGFTAELIKLAGGQADRETAELRALYRTVKKQGQKKSGARLARLRGKGRTVSRDYLASAMIGATATPAAILLGNKISRLLHNKDLRRAMKGVRRKRRRAISTHLETGPTIGRSGIHAKGKKPLMTHADLAGTAVRGGAMGSIIQMLRDKFSGSAGRGDSRR